MRGSSHEAPMSAPESPTLVKRKAIFALSAATRRSQAAAITAPAPATRPLSAATTGRRQRRMARISSPVDAREVEQALVVALEERADDVLDVAARAEGAAAAGEHDGAHAGLAVERAGRRRAARRRPRR